jgi:hypothetical protein
MKKPTTITAAEVPRIFSDAHVRLMASTAGLEEIAEDKLQGFAASVQHAALIYLNYEPTSNEVHRQIDELVRAALRAAKARKRPDVACEEVVSLIERLSKQATKIMNRFCTLPDAETLRDPARQRDACETVARLGRMGAYFKLGRKRDRGKRSVTEVSVLYAPTLQQHPRRRDAQIAFLMGLEAAYVEATGEAPTPTANLNRPGPYARFVRACLDQLRAAANAVELINERDRRRKIMQLRHMVLRWDAAVAGIANRLSHQNP